MNEQITQKMTDKNISLSDLNSKCSYAPAASPNQKLTEETLNTVGDDSSLEPIEEGKKNKVILARPTPSRKFSAKKAFQSALQGIRASNIMMQAIEEEHFPEGSDNKALKALQ